MEFKHKHALVADVGVFVAVILLFGTVADSARGHVNWSQFRGPNGQGVTQADHIPIHFSPDTNVIWKTALPPGSSSPVIWNDHIFLTAHDATDKSKLMTLAINRKDGRMLWRHVGRGDARVRVHSMNSPASSTPVADDKHVYVYFGTHGLFCCDHTGRMVWNRKMDTPENRYGMATSPILHGDMVILVLDNDGGTSRLLAVNRETGETVWEQPRSLFSAGWSTPMIWRHDDVEELVVLGAKRLTSYNPSTGEEIWWAGGFSPETVGIPVASEGLLFVSASALAGRGDEESDVARMWKITVEEFDLNHDNQIQRSEMTERFTVPVRPDLARDNPGYGWPISDMDGLLRFFDKNEDRIIAEWEWMQTMSGFARTTQPHLLAIRPGARNDAYSSHVAWESHRGVPETPSLLYCHGRLYLMRDAGLLTCLEASSGRELFRERLGAPGQYIASPIAAGDKVIVASLRGVVTVIQVGDELDILAKNDLGERIHATPAVAENKLYLRTADHLYAFGQ